VQDLEKISRSTKTAHGGWRPGSGRPLGVPNRLTQPIKELAGEYSRSALAVLVAIMEGGQSEQARIMASREILDRAHGKPRQPREDGGRKVINVSVNRGGGQPTPALPIEEAE